MEPKEGLHPRLAVEIDLHLLYATFLIICLISVSINSKRELPHKVEMITIAHLHHAF